MRAVKTDSGRSMISYVFATLLCSIIGKIIVTRFFFDYPIVILIMQSAATLFIIEVARVLGVIKVAPYSFEKGRKIVVPSILYTIAQWITVASFEGIAMPNYDSVKRFTPLLIIAGMAANQRHQKFEQNRILLIAVISIASAVAVNLEFSVDRYSFFYGIVGASFQAAAFLQFEQHISHFSNTEILYMHSFNSLVMYLLADIVRDEIREAFMYMITSAHPLFLVVFAISIISGILFHFATFSCLEKCGSLNMQIVSNIRAIIETFLAYYLSIYLFYDVYPGIINWIFMGLAIVGARVFCATASEPEIVKGPWITKA